VTLKDCPLDMDLLIRAVRFEADAALRMREIGLRPGGTVRVIQRAAFGGRLIAAGAGRLALDGATAACVDVEVAPS
jgi:ferrous iron transport protein A